MKTKEKRDNKQQQKQQKANKNKNLKKLHNPRQQILYKKWYKYSNKTDQIDGSNWETQFYQNGSIRFGLLELESHGNAEFEQEMISLKERVDQDREFTHVFFMFTHVLFSALFVW